MESSLFDLAGRVALITGGTKGIGLAIARALGGAGARLLLVARDLQAGEEAESRFRASGLEAHFFPADVSERPGAEGAVGEALRRWGKLDILVTSAGALVVKPALELEPEEVERQLAVNVKGVFFCCQAAGRHMVAARRGKIVLLSSILAEGAVPNQSVYIATKGAMGALARALAAEWSPHNVQVNALGPGLTRSPMTEGLLRDEARTRHIISRTPAGRVGEPEDLLGAALFLASSASDFLTGQTIFVDGGRLALS
ncbi:MAG: SDR family NAD(P)-dependent oxidoreductase [Nitrospinota bacterium]